MGTPAGQAAPPGALRPEAPEKPRPPKGYAVPHRAPARDRAGTHAAGSTLRRSQPGPPTRGSPVRRSPRALESVKVQGPGALILKEKTASRAREISHALLGSCVFFWRGAPGVELNDGHAIVGVLPGAITGIVKEGNGCDPSILTAEDLIRLDLHLRVHGEPSF